jgi:hypothetical protein
MTARRAGLGAGVAALSLLVASPALAQPGEATAADPAPETRKQMATVHERMAECLRSDRPIAECRTEMMASCRALRMHEGDCPMMGAGGRGMGPGMGTGRMGPGTMRPGTSGGAPPAPEQ